MMFVDASTMIAILTRESDADALANALESEEAAITSPVAIFEATAGVCRKRQSPVDAAYREVLRLAERAEIEIVPITALDAAEAISAFARYGKGRGHPAQLNLGDCFAYAVAKAHTAPILFKGDDFSKTDIATVRVF
jgi:ribonuclease VapC